MKIPMEQIRQLREKTGAGISNCRDALIEASGDFDKAITILRQKGLATAEKKSTRITKQGMVSSYVHTGAKVGVLLELNCETDFVARRSEFKQLAKTLAMQIAATPSITYLSENDIPESVIASEMKIELEREDIKDKPENIRQSIVKGRVEKSLKNFTLLSQPYLSDPSLTVEDTIKEYIAILGENIQIARFDKYILGGN